MTRQGYALPRPASPRKWLTVLALLAFFLQSLVVQTHVHLSLAQPSAKTGEAQPLPGPAPVKIQDPLDPCRRCQELAYAGNFFTPSVVVLVVSLSFAAAIFAILRVPADDSHTAFAWQSRAPPR